MGLLLRVAALLSAVLSAVVAGCITDPTQLVVVVDSDYAAESELRGVCIVVTGDGRDARGSLQTVARDPAAGQAVVPFSFGVLPPAGDPTQSVRIMLAARDDDACPEDVTTADPLVVRTAQTGFRRDTRLRLPLFLSRQCAPLWESCEALGLTCIPEIAGCGRYDRDEDELDAVTPGQEEDAPVEGWGGVDGCPSDCSTVGTLCQPDGTSIPTTSPRETDPTQTCLDWLEGDGMVDFVADARPLATFVPEPDAMGRRVVRFQALTSTTGFQNSVGWYWAGDDPLDPDNLHLIFGCKSFPRCDCPCDTIRTVTVDFDAEGFAPGRAVAMWIRSGEDGGDSGVDVPGCPEFDETVLECNVGLDPAEPGDDDCAGRVDVDRPLFTSLREATDAQAYKVLTWPSVASPGAFYVGFEDLPEYRSDHDYQDELLRVEGATASPCAPPF